MFLKHNTLKADLPVCAYLVRFGTMLFSRGQFALCLQACDAVKGPGSHVSVGPRCNQQMHLEALEPLLVHSDARMHLAELWSGEAADPQKARSKLEFDTC